jgi:hypothetical protein
LIKQIINKTIEQLVASNQLVDPHVVLIIEQTNGPTDMSKINLIVENVDPLGNYSVIVITNINTTTNTTNPIIVDVKNITQEVVNTITNTPTSGKTCTQKTINTSGEEVCL